MGYRQFVWVLEAELRSSGRAASSEAREGLEFTAVPLLQKNQVWLPALIWWFITTHNSHLRCSVLISGTRHTWFTYICASKIFIHINNLKGQKEQ